MLPGELRASEAAETSTSTICSYTSAKVAASSYMWSKETTGPGASSRTSSADGWRSVRTKTRIALWMADLAACETRSSAGRADPDCNHERSIVRHSLRLRAKAATTWRGRSSG